MSKISVILPVYNGEKYLESSIQSVLQQLYKNFELIIVDDCSTDRTADISQKYATENDNVVYIRNEKNIKLPNSLNKGFSLANGYYWTWTSCDNIYSAQAFEYMVKEFNQNDNLGLVYSDMEIIDEVGDVCDYFKAGHADDLIFKNVVGACFLYKALAAKKIGEYNPDLFLCEDYEYWLRFAQLTSLKPINKCLYKYRRHKESLSNSYKQEVIAKGIKVQKKYYSIFIKTRKMAAVFYAHLRARDIYNPFRQGYLLFVFFFSPALFFTEIKKIINGLILR